MYYNVMDVAPGAWYRLCRTQCRAGAGVPSLKRGVGGRLVATGKCITFLGFYGIISLPAHDAAGGARRYAVVRRL